MKETMKRRRSRIDSNRNGNGISVVAESPERKTRYYSGIPDLSVTTSDSFNESSLFKRALSGKLLRFCFVQSFISDILKKTRTFYVQRIRQ